MRLFKTLLEMAKKFFLKTTKRSSRNDETIGIGKTTVATIARQAAQDATRNISVNATVIWKLQLSAIGIKEYTDISGLCYDPPRIQISLLRVEGDMTSVFTVEDLPSGMSVKYGGVMRSNGTTAVEMAVSQSSFTVPRTYSSIYLSLYDQDTMLDKVQLMKFRDGVDGVDGADGSSPVAVFRGNYRDYDEDTGEEIIYYGNYRRRDIVFLPDEDDPEEGEYFIARMRGQSNYFSLVPPPNNTYWERFSGQFEMVATRLLLAREAWIDKLSVGDVKLYMGDNVVGGFVTQKGTALPKLWLGASTFEDAPFGVDHTGEIKATKGVFAGSLELAGGTFKGFLQTHFEDIDDKFRSNKYTIDPESPNVRVSPLNKRSRLLLPPANSLNEGMVCNIWIDPSDFSSWDGITITISVDDGTGNIDTDNKILYLKEMTSSPGQVIGHYFEQVRSIVTVGGQIQLTCISHKISSSSEEYYWYVSNMKLHQPTFNYS